MYTGHSQVAKRNSAVFGVNGGFSITHGKLNAQSRHSTYAYPLTAIATKPTSDICRASGCLQVEEQLLAFGISDRSTSNIGHSQSCDQSISKTEYRIEGQISRMLADS